MKLVELPIRQCGRIIDVGVDPQFQLRLNELGVRQGARFISVNRSVFGGRVINIAGTRIAVDRRSAGVIEIEPESAA